MGTPEIVKEISKNETNETALFLACVRQVIELIGQPRVDVKDILNAQVGDFEPSSDSGTDIAKKISHGLGFKVHRWDRIGDIAKQLEAMARD